MHSINYNLSLTEAMLDEIERYLLSSELFWPLSARAPSGTPHFPRLTLGGLLLAFDELRAHQADMDALQSQQFRVLHSRFEEFKSTWFAAMERKAFNELRCRINLWKAYLFDLEEDADEADRFPQEVRNRMMISHLSSLASSLPETQELKPHIQYLDSRMWQTFKSGEFVLAERLRAVYPREEYPFLYAQARSKAGHS
jgi:hypothetical protein